MKAPNYLKEGDTIGILAPAKAIDKRLISNAENFWISKGFKVKIGLNAAGQYNYFSGTTAARYQDFETMLSDETVKAIICARGGYGSVSLLDRLNWSGMFEHPKWIIGFSDITFFLQHLNKLGIMGIHGTMPLNYEDNSDESKEALVKLLKGEKMNYQWSTQHYSNGIIEGRLLGGNLSVLCSLIGTNSMPNYDGAILFIEDVGEHLYAIDRMFYSLSKSGILDKIKGLIVGDFSNIKDTETPFGCSLQEIVMTHLKYRNVAVAFDFPAGHCNHNLPLVIGKKIKLSIKDGSCKLIV